MTQSEHDTTPQTEGEPSIIITVFSKNNCPKCGVTTRRLTSAGVEHRYINVEEDTEPREEFGGLTPREYVIQEFGTSMPAVEIVERGSRIEHWNDINPVKLTQTVQKYGTTSN